MTLDNQTSRELEDFFRSVDIDYQYMPAGMHRANPAERAIQTFKNHFIALLCTTHPNFPLQQHDQLLLHAELTLNLLRSSLRVPGVSAWEA